MQPASSRGSQVRSCNELLTGPEAVARVKVYQGAALFLLLCHMRTGLTEEHAIFSDAVTTSGGKITGPDSLLGLKAFLCIFKRMFLKH